MNPNVNLANATIFHLLVMGLVFGITQVKKCKTSMLGFVLGLRGILDTNMLLSLEQKSSIRGYAQYEAPKLGQVPLALAFQNAIHNIISKYEYI